MANANVIKTRIGRCFGCHVERRGRATPDANPGCTAVSGFFSGLIMAACDPNSARATIAGLCKRHQGVAMVTMEAYADQYGWTPDVLTTRIDWLLEWPDGEKG